MYRSAWAGNAKTPPAAFITLPLTVAVPPEKAIVPLLVSPVPLKLRVRPAPTARFVLFSIPSPAVKSALKLTVPLLTRRPLNVPLS